jgi:hypothetical protein
MTRRSYLVKGPRTKYERATSGRYRRRTGLFLLDVMISARQPCSLKVSGWMLLASARW